MSIATEAAKTLCVCGHALDWHQHASAFTPIRLNGRLIERWCVSEGECLCDGYEKARS